MSNMKRTLMVDGVLVPDIRGGAPEPATGTPTSAADFAAMVRTEIEGVKTALRTHVTDEVARKYGEAEKTLAEIRITLAKLEERGDVSPIAKEVKDLEARLIESEKLQRELVGRLSTLPIHAKEAEEARDAEKFKGCLFTDLEAVQKMFNDRKMAMLSGRGGQSQRAIDQSLLVTGGALSAETADRFLDFVITQQTALSRVTTMRMNSPERHTDELRINARSLRKATPGLSQATAEAIGTKRRTLTTVSVIWPEDIVLEFLEDNIERRGAEGHIMQLLSRQFGNDLNDLAWNGDIAEDSSNGDPFIAINQGWIALALLDSEVHDMTTYAGGDTNSSVLRSMFRDLPVKYKGLPGLGFFVPIPFAERYADEVAARETALGDQVMINGLPALRHFGLPVVPEAHLYEENVDRAMLTPFQNLHHGIQRQVTIDSMWQPRPGTIEITIRARNDYEYATGDAIVLASSIPSQLR